MTRTAVVTGSAGGIGLVIAQRMRGDGWRVHGIDVRVPDENASNDDHVLDLRDVRALEQLLLAFRDVDALVNNAAVMWTDRIVDSDLAAFDDLLAVNLRAPFVTMKTLHPALARTRGSVVNIASVHAAATSPGAAPYAASKGGLLALTRSAALEFAPLVRVNAICPGAINTPMLADGLSRDPELADFLLARTPAGRLGAPAEVAEAVAFLVDGARSGYITGQSLTVDGGVLARLSTE